MAVPAICQNAIAAILGQNCRHGHLGCRKFLAPGNSSDLGDYWQYQIHGGARKNLIPNH